MKTTSGFWKKMKKKKKKKKNMRSFKPKFQKDRL